MPPRALVSPALLSLALLTTACGDGSGPTGPTVESDIRALVIDRPFLRGSLLVGDSARLTARGVTERGDTVPVFGVTWSSDALHVAAFGPSGHLVGISFGQANITATSGSRSVTVPILVAGTLHSLPVVSSEVWDLRGAPHVVDSLLAVGGESLVTLTVEAGVSVFFRDGAGLNIGLGGEGRLLADGAAGPILFEHEDPDAVRGAWWGLQFRGPSESVLVDAIVRGCGAAWNGLWPYPACVALRTLDGLGSPGLALKDVTIDQALGFGLVAEPGTHFVAGSTGLSVKSVDGYPAIVPASELARFPYGGRFSGSAPERLVLFGGTLTEDAEWRDAGVPWLLAGELVVAGPSDPVLTMRSGLHVQFDYSASVVVGEGQPGSVRVGAAAGPPVVLEDGYFTGGSGWGGIHLLARASLSSLTNVDLSGCGVGYRTGCLGVTGDGAGATPTLLVDGVRIVGASSYGVQVSGGGRFDPSSRDLSVSASGAAPLRIDADAVSGIPSGSYTGNARDEIFVDGGQIAGDHRWSNRGVPYVLTGGLGLEHPTLPLLTLDPGVRLLFAPGAGVYIGRLGPGSLRAAGTAASPIVFGSSLDTPHPGSWTGISVEALAGAATLFEHVVIEDAGPPGGPADGSLGGAIAFMTDLGPVLRASVVRRSATCGILRAGPGPWVTDFTEPDLGNTFEANAGGDQCGG